MNHIFSLLVLRQFDERIPTAIPIFLIRANLPLSTSSKLLIIASWDRADGSAAACFNLNAPISI
jgi:hypothetical protein